MNGLSPSNSNKFVWSKMFNYFSIIFGLLTFKIRYLFYVRPIEISNSYFVLMFSYFVFFLVNINTFSILF